MLPIIPFIIIYSSIGIVYLYNQILNNPRKKKIKSDKPVIIGGNKNGKKIIN